MFKRAWNIFSWFVGGYSIYKQLQTANEAKNEIYSTLSPEQQEMWNSTFGAPTVAAPQMVMPSIPVVNQPQSTNLSNLRAGT